MSDFLRGEKKAIGRMGGWIGIERKKERKKERKNPYFIKEERIITQTVCNIIELSQFMLFLKNILVFLIFNIIVVLATVHQPDQNQWATMSLCPSKPDLNLQPSKNHQLMPEHGRGPVTRSKAKGKRKKVNPVYRVFNKAVQTLQDIRETICYRVCEVLQIMWRDSNPNPSQRSSTSTACLIGYLFIYLFQDLYLKLFFFSAFTSGRVIYQQIYHI